MACGRGPAGPRGYVVRKHAGFRTPGVRQHAQQRPAWAETMGGAIGWATWAMAHPIMNICHKWAIMCLAHPIFEC